MTKVIIEVNSLQNNDLIGKLVISKAGRDNKELYIVVDFIDTDYVLLANGYNKKVDKPKKKKLKHIILTDIVNNEIKEAILNKDKDMDIKIKKFLKLKDIVKEGWLPYVKRWCYRNARSSGWITT